MTGLAVAVAVGLAFVVAAAAGALARVECGRRWNRHDGLPLGTLVVNVTGSFALGAVSDVAGAAATVIGVGALGAYTTFSSFGRDVVALVELRRTALAGAYVALSLGLGTAAAWLGVILATR